MSKVSGLTTVALLKANYDEGMDYLEMFLPFVLHTICEKIQDVVEIDQVQQQIYDTFEIKIPKRAIKTLLNKAKRAGAVNREGGKFLKNNDYQFDNDINHKRKKIDRQLHSIGTALTEYLNENNFTVESIDEALGILFKFLSIQESELLLDLEYENKPIDSGVLKTKRIRGVAKFVKEKCLKDPNLAEYLNNILIGFVLQNALLLKNIATPSKVFDDLQIYLDSGFIIGLLGLKGEARELANKETLSLLKSTNAHLAVFEPTISEIKRILYTYEKKLGTQRGREDLWQSDITRYVLSEKLTPSDIKQEISLLENKLEFDFGITIYQTPDRVPEYTLDENALAKKLGVENLDNPSKRIMHDIDCVAGILTLRKGDKPRTLDTAKAIFMSGSSTVVHDVREWYEDMNMSGVKPIMHHQILTNIAWLKRPEAGSDIKINELTALCTAALKPKKETWDKFLNHLKKLEESGDLSSDESVAIVASSMIENELVELEITEDEIDSNSVNEVVNRVKDDYRKQAQKVIEQKDTKIQNIQESFEKLSKGCSYILFYFLGFCIALGSVLLLPNVMEKFGIGILGWVLAILIICLTVYSLIFGFTLNKFRENIESIIGKKLNNWFLN